jgi:hypothetical protein
MSPRTRYWTLHWLRVALWPLPVLTLFKVGRATVNAARRMMTFTIICGLTGAIAMAQDKNIEAARQGAESWLAFVDKGDYAGSYDEEASIFKFAVTKEDWLRKVQAARGLLGNVISRTLKSAQHKTSLPGAPDGEYVVIQYDTSFDHKRSAVETITPTLDKDAHWRVSGYFIR